MTNTWALCALWVGLALAATLLAIWFKISTALSEIVVAPSPNWSLAYSLPGSSLCAGRTCRQYAVDHLPGRNWRNRADVPGRCGTRSGHLQTKWREASIIGLAGFFGPFLGCTAIAHYVLHWAIMPSWLCGVAFRQRLSPLYTQ